MGGEDGLVMNVEVIAEDTAEDEDFAEGALKGDVNGAVEITAEDAAKDTGVVGAIVVDVPVNAVLGNIVVAATPAVPVAAVVVVPGVLESALVVG